MRHLSLRHLIASTLLSLLAACGGGGGGGSGETLLGSTPQPNAAVVPPSSTPAASGTPATPAAPETAAQPSEPAPVAQPVVALSRKEAARFLGRATFGANLSSIDALAASDASAWLTTQFAKPQTLHRAYIDRMLAVQAAGGA